jgi:hypothetical protein
MIVKLNNKWAVWWLLELSIVSVIVLFITTWIYTIITDSYQKYSNYKIQKYVVEQNNNILKHLGSIRFWEWVSVIDQYPVNHPNHTYIQIQLPQEEIMELRPIDYWTWTNDISFIYKWQELFMYDKEVIDIKKFLITPLDNSVNRWWLKFDIELWAYKDNFNASKRFWNVSYDIKYSITYTFRNTSTEE